MAIANKLNGLTLQQCKLLQRALIVLNSKGGVEAGELEAYDYLRGQLFDIRGWLEQQDYSTEGTPNVE